MGIDFIQDAGIIIDNADQRWWLKEFPEDVQPLSFETISGESLADIMSIELREDEGTLLSTIDRERVTSFLVNNLDIFQPGGEPTDYIEHHIELVNPNQIPIAVPPYQLSGNRKALLRREIDKMIEDGVIEECESPWAAPVVMVPKKNNEVRVCIDYRKLNEVTVTDRYPLPRIDDLLHLAKQTLFMSSIDLKAGYWQVRVKDSDRDMTAFITPFGLFRFKRMPFGLKNAPATFQRLIDRFRTGLPNITILAYLDDIIVISNGFDRHLDDLELVFQRLRQFKLVANREKCQFLRQNIKFLGHLITSDGIQTDPSKVSAILDMKPPINVTQVRTFLQTCSWYRRFIEKFAEIARPLTNLTKKSSPWFWGESENGAFMALKRLLTESPILRQADDTLPFIIRTDASQYALGAVLLQGEKFDEKPIEYASRLLIAAERNYSTTEREALAVVWALNKFRGYIEGAEIIIGTDHQPLKWLFSLKTPIGRLARWVMLVQSFNLSVNYTPGKINVVADTLSRPPRDEEADIVVSAVEIDFPQKGPTKIREEQLDDEELAKIVRSFETKDDPNLENYLSRGYLLEQGVLFRYMDDECDEPQLVVPNQLRHHILQRFHNDPTAGHYGADRTINKIVTKYYWPGIRKDITEYCRKCVECQKYKAANHKPFGLLKTPVMSQRFEVLAVDLFGPLPETDDGYKHILILEDVCTRWVELYSLKLATALDCAIILINEVFLRFGFPRRLISDNGVQFVSEIMQQALYCLGINQNLTPFYHPSANPVERRNRDLKTQLGILVGPHHREWAKFLPSIRFAMNTTKCETTGQTPAFLTFGRELRILEDVSNDIRSIVQSENFIPQITPYLWKLQGAIKDAREMHEHKQDHRTEVANTRRQHRQYNVGDLVLINSHTQSKTSKGFSSKLAPRRDGPYRVCKIINSNTYEIETADRDKVLVGKYNVSALTPYNGEEDSNQPLNPIRRRGRPRQGNLINN